MNYPYIDEYPVLSTARTNYHLHDRALGYSRYIWWQRGEQAILSHEEAGTVPRLDLHLLVNLHRVKTLDFHKQAE